MLIVRGAALTFEPASHEDSAAPGVYKRVLLQKEQLAPGRLQMVNWALLPAHASFRPHYHEDMEEIFIILNGRVALRTSDQEYVLEAGDAAVIPCRQVHSMTNMTAAEVQYLVVGISRGEGGKTVLSPWV